MLKADAGYRTAHHGEAIVPTGGGQFAGQDLGPGVVWNRDGLVITRLCRRSHTHRPAYGYRIAYKGRTVVVSGDTGVTPGHPAGRQGRGRADSRSPAAKACCCHHARAGECRPAAHRADHARHPQLSRLARTGSHRRRPGGVQMLMLTHIVPQVPNRFFEAAFLGDAAQRFFGVDPDRPRWQRAAPAGRQPRDRGRPALTAPTRG